MEHFFMVAARSFAAARTWMFSRSMPARPLNLAGTDAEDVPGVVRPVRADTAVQDAAQDDIAQGKEQGAEEQRRAQQGDGDGVQRLSGARVCEYLQ